MAVGYHRPYRLASAPPLTRHSLVALGLISRLGGLDHGIVQGHRGAVAEAVPRTMSQSFGLPCMLYLEARVGIEPASTALQAAA